ncbi:MAG: SCO family protein [Candidatus Eremiobacteraeota bacterium]|nr:SCO family protein [Candidatus Eremiobacteraeota bacterium]
MHRFAIVAASNVLAVVMLAFACAASPSALLQDQRGMPFDLQMLRGSPVVLTFIATHCRDACPLVNAQFEQLQRELQRTHVPIRLLTLTLDPQHDHLSDIQRIARTFEADPKHWILATGARPAIGGIMRRFGVVTQTDERGYADVHTTFIYLLDRRGRLVKTMLAGSNLSADLFTELQHDWRKLN